ncbi:MAG: phytanoyl-CoA dioxygenase family protein [Alphaproteobacteria bacterium]|nr:phytanoyl-CoA dioxygenase family protein [Alphaproteobacteria bacterium]
MAHLSTAEQAQYQRDGWVIPQWRLPAARVDAMRAALDKLIADNPGIRPEKLISAHIAGKSAEGVRGSQDFLDLARDPEIVELVADAIGENIILWGCQVFCKPGGDGLETPWHQDGHYWPVRPLATCTVWLALDPSTRTNGCLRVIPGSHASRTLLNHMREDRTDVVLTEKIDDPTFDESKAVDIELQPGQMSLHDVYMIHGANANRSPQRRAGVAIRYMPTTSVFEHTLMERSDKSGYMVDFTQRPIWLVRGRDVSGRNNLTIGHARRESATVPA